MARTTATIPDDLTDLMKGAIKAVSSKTRAMPFATSSASISRKNGTPGFATVVSLYSNGEITMGTAARLAVVNRFEMRDLLREEGVELRVGPEDMTAARDEIEAAHDLE